MFIYIYIYLYVYMYVCTYVCIYIFAEKTLTAVGGGVQGVACATQRTLLAVLARCPCEDAAEPAPDSGTVKRDSGTRAS